MNCINKYVKIEYNGIEVNYIRIGDGEKCVLYLHGWGGNLNSFLGVAKNINATNILIDFPPFGESQTPKFPWTVKDYAIMVKKIIEIEGINNFSIVSHSFGSRVAIYLANIYNSDVEKLIITGGAGLKTKSLKKTFRKIKYKIIKFFNKNAVVGSKDYINLCPVMKKTFSNIVNEDLGDLCNKITCKTLLIYGSKDKETPIIIAKRYHKLIKNSKLKIYKNFGHFAYLENFNEFILDTNIFLRE